MKHPFDEFNDRDQQAEFRIQRVAEFEYGKVMLVLRRFGLVKTVHGLRELDSDGKLTFAAFNEAHGSFPMLLATNHLPGVSLHTDRRVFWPSLFSRFHDVPFVRAYDEWHARAAEHAGTRSIGLVFPRKGFRQGMVIHNGLDGYHVPGTFLGYVGGNKKTPVLYVHSFQVVLDSIHNKGHGWRPDA